MSPMPAETLRSGFTAAQTDAIGASGESLLVSAAAGSGKTRVLVERVIERVLDPVRPVPIDHFLVVTFTDAAAAEMRQRIARRLDEELTKRPDDRHLREQLVLLPRASISTIHSFCLKILREHFHRIALDPAATVLGEHEARLLVAESLEAVFSRRHAREEPRFLALVTAYGGGEAPVAVKRLVVGLHSFTRSLARPERWLDEAARRFEVPANGGIAATPYWNAIRQWLEVELGRLRAELAALRVAALAPGGPAAYASRLTVEHAFFVRACAALERVASWDELLAAWPSDPFDRLPPAKNVIDEARKEWIKKRRNWAKGRFDTLTARLGGTLEPQWLDDLASLAPHAHELVSLVKAVDAEYAARKRRRSALDFDDLEHAALEVLGSWDEARREFDRTDLARELSTRFHEVLVDEYQDVNGVQEAILALVSRDAGDKGDGNRFLVGDVKQSIYGFRHSDPAVFQARLREYRRSPRSAAIGRAIVLSENFRSRRPVLAAVNFLFRQLMTEAVGHIAYDDDAELRYGARYPEAGSVVADLPVELHLVERTDANLAGETGEDAAVDAVLATDPDEADEQPDAAVGPEADAAALTRWLDDASAAEREAQVAVARARAIVEGDSATNAPPALVWERHGIDAPWKSRKACWSDVVVLLRSVKNRATSFVTVFEASGIPAHADVGTGWFAVTEIETMLSLLTALENPRQDIPLAAALLSPLGGFRAADLARMRLADRRADFIDAVRASAAGSGDGDATGLDAEIRDRLRTFLARLDEWRTAARREPLSRVIWRIYSESRFLDVASAMPGGAGRRANLLALFDRAREFDHFARQGLTRFLAFIEKLAERDQDLGTASPVGAGENAVRVLTVHKSKGLEFPFVIVAGLGTEWNDRDQAGDVIFDRDLGLGLRVVNLTLRARYPSLAHHAVRAARARALRAEELRVLYVALTRARERLVLIGSVRGLGAECLRWASIASASGARLDEALVAGARRPLDWIAPAVARHPHGSPIRDLQPARPAPRRATDSTATAAPREDSDWSVQLWTRTELERVVRVVDRAAKPAADWSGIARLDPAAFGEPSDPHADEDRRVLATRFAWSYPHSAVTGQFAKLSVTELKSRFPAAAPTDDDAEQVSSETIHWPVAGVKRARKAKRPASQAVRERPSFLDTSPRTPTAAEIGTATHLALRHLESAVWGDASAAAAAMDDLVARGLMSAEQARAARLDSIVAFGSSELGRRLAAHPERLRREVPFTLGIAAGEVHDQLAGAAARDIVVVQGVIDLLADLGPESGFLLLDYKTDRVSPADVADTAEAYRGQMALYARAVEQIFSRPVTERWLCFLTAGTALRL